MTDCKVLLEVVSQKDVINIQKKLNQWITTGLLLKFDITPLADGNILFRICMKKGAEN